MKEGTSQKRHKALSPDGGGGGGVSPKHNSAAGLEEGCRRGEQKKPANAVCGK